VTARQRKITLLTIAQGIALAILAYISQGIYWVYIAVALSTFAGLYAPFSHVERKKAKAAVKSDFGEAHFYSIFFSMLLIFIYVMIISI